MHRPLLQTVFSIVLVGQLSLATPILLGQAAEKPKQGQKPASAAAADEPKAKPVATVTAEQKRLAVYKTLSGRLESEQATEVKTDFEKWTDLKIEQVAPQGPVKKGELLIQFDAESIDKAITDAEFGVQSADFSHQLAQLAAKNATETLRLDDAMAELAWKSAQEDDTYYRDVEVPQRKKDLAYDEKSAGYGLEYANDELGQLQQMYTEDELTEESELIVLKRAQRSVEAAQRRLDQSLLSIKRRSDFRFPRADQRQDDSFARAKMAYEKSRITLPIAKEKADIAVAKAAFELEQKKKSLAETKADRSLMTIVAPADGFMFYGKADRGKWSAGAGSRELKVDDKVKASGVVMTVVDNRQLKIRTSIPEGDIDDLAAGMQGRAKFAAAGSRLIPVVIQSVARVPLGDGSFDCVVTFDVQTAGKLLAGMACKMSFQVYENDAAIVVPKASVFSDDDGFSHYVYRIADDQTQRIDVQVGRTSGKEVEVLAGLSAGDKIHKAKPGAK